MSSIDQNSFSEINCKYRTWVQYISDMPSLPNCMIDDDDIMIKISNEFMSTKTKVIIRFSEAVKQIRHRHQPGEN